MQKISYVIPCYRSQHTVGEVVAEITATMKTMPQYDYEVILVNDCSPDDTIGTIRALEAAEKLAAEGIDVEVIDPRTIAPLDKDTIFNSFRKTHRAAVGEESYETAGIGAELAAMFQEELYDELDGPVARSAALDVPMPYNIAMEHYSIPDVNRICASIRAKMD